MVAEQLGIEICRNGDVLMRTMKTWGERRETANRLKLQVVISEVKRTLTILVCVMLFDPPFGNP